MTLARRAFLLGTAALTTTAILGIARQPRTYEWDKQQGYYAIIHPDHVSTVEQWRAVHNRLTAIDRKYLERASPSQARRAVLSLQARIDAGRA